MVDSREESLYIARDVIGAYAKFITVFSILLIIHSLSLFVYSRYSSDFRTFKQFFVILNEEAWHSEELSEIIDSSKSPSELYDNWVHWMIWSGPDRRIDDNADTILKRLDNLPKINNICLYSTVWDIALLECKVTDAGNPMFMVSTIISGRRTKLVDKLKYTSLVIVLFDSQVFNVTEIVIVEICALVYVVMLLSVMWILYWYKKRCWQIDNVLEWKY